MTLLRRRTFLMSVGAAGLIGGCHGGSDAQLRIGTQKNGLLLLARTRGSVDAAFARAGQRAPQWIEFPSGPPMMEAMHAGAIDFGAVGETPPIVAQANGSPIRYFAREPTTGLANAILVPAGSPIHSISQLRGRRIGFTRGSAAQLILAKTLGKAGLSFAEVNPISLNPDDAFSAFAAGAIDAWAIWDPFYALAVARSGARAIITGADLPPSDAFFVGPESATRTVPGQIALLLRALRAEAQWARHNVAEAVRLIARGTGLAESIVTVSLRRGPFDVAAIDTLAIARQQVNADLLAQLGIIRSRVDIAAAVWRDPSTA